MRKYLPNFNLNLSRRDWYILLGTLALLLAIPLTIILLKRYQESRIRAVANAQIVEGSVKVTNIHAHGFTVSWETVGESAGYVLWGPSGGTLLTEAYDDRSGGDPAFSSSTHYVTLPYPPGSEQSDEYFATPSQLVDFQIVSGDGKFYGGTFDNQFSVFDVTEGAVTTVTTGPEIAKPTYFTGKSLIAPLFLRYWPSQLAGTRQWSTIRLNNHGTAEATVTLSFRGTDSFQIERTIPANGVYTSIKDEELQNTLSGYGQFRGFVKIESNQPLSGILRQTFLEDRGAEATVNDPLVHSTDTPLLADDFIANKLLVPLFVRHWTTRMVGHKHWSVLTLSNPGDSSAEITSLRFIGVGADLNNDGQPDPVNLPLESDPNQPWVIEPGGMYTTYNDPALENLGDFAGFAIVESDQPLVGSVRDVFVKGDAKLEEGEISSATDTLVYPDDQIFRSTILNAPFFVRHWDTRMPDHKQWSTIRLNNRNEEEALAVLDFVGQNRQGEAVTLTVQRTIQPNSVYDSINDGPLNQQLGELGDFMGYLQIGSNRPLSGSIRQAFLKNQTTPSVMDPLTLALDLPLFSTGTLSKKLTVPLYTRNWYSQVEGQRQWSNLRLVNYDHAEEATFNLNFYGWDANYQTVSRSFGPKTIPPQGSYFSFDDSELDSLGDFAGFVVVESDRPLVGAARDVWAQGGKTGAVSLASDIALFDKESTDRELKCHFSTPDNPDPLPTEDVAPGCPDPVYGEVQQAEGTAAPGTIVYLFVRDGDSQDSPESAMPLSAITNEQGRYVIELGNARTADLSDYFSYNRNGGDLEDIYARGGTLGQAELLDNSTSNDEPIPTLVLNHPPVIEPIADQEIPEGVPYEYQVVATDADGDQLTYDLGCPGADDCPMSVVIDPLTGYISWSNPKLGDVLDLVVSVSDQKSGSPVTEEFRLTVVELPDEEAPETEIVSGPEEGAIITENSAIFTFTGTDNRTATENLVYSFRLDDQEWSEYSSRTVAAFAFFSGSDGPHTFYVRAKDEAGLVDESPATRTFVVDTQGPTITHTPVTDAAAGERVNIEATIADPSGVAAAKIFYRNPETGDFSNRELNFTDDDGDGVYSAWIPDVDVVEPWVDYYITATDSNGFSSASPENAPPAGEGYYRISVSAPAIPALNRVEIRPAEANLTVGQTQKFEAVAYDTNDQPISLGVEFNWYLGGDVGSLSELPDGAQFRLFTAEANGHGTLAVTATAGDRFVATTAEIYVSQSQLSCSIAPESFPIAPGEQQTLTAAVTGGSGAGYNYSWSASDGSFAGPTDGQSATWQAPSNAADGAKYQIFADVTDKATGVTCATAATSTATIEVPSPGLNHVIITPASATMSVGETKSFSAQAYDANNNPVSGVTYTWDVSGGIGNVSPSSGASTTFTATAPSLGSVNVTAALAGSEPVSKSASISVYSALSCQVSPSSFEIAPGGSKTLTTAVIGGSGEYTYNWTKTSGSFVGGTTSPSATWRADASAADGSTATITVTVTDSQTQGSCTRDSAATVRAPAPVLASVTIAPASWTTPNGVGDTQQFTATARDTNGSDITDQVSFSWSTGGGVGTISPATGASTTFSATAPGTGSVDVAATLGDVTVNDSAQVTVKDNVPPANITDLTVTGSTQTSLSFSWTAPGDDGNTGTASGYDLRCATETITDANWDSAQQAIGEPTPQAAGSTETFTFDGLTPGTNYYCAIKTADEVPNWSGLSNIAQGATEEAPPTTATLNISLSMQGRPSANDHPRGHSGTVDIFARESGGTAKLWEVDDQTIDADGEASGITLSGLTIGETYEFLLKGFIHLTKKISHTLAEGVNSLDFGSLLTGDFDGNDQVNSLDNDVLLTGWQQTWNSPKSCNGDGQTYADCNRADFNLDSKVNSIDWDYIFANWGKNGDE